MSRVLIVGAGAAGMYAAVWAARNGQEVCVFEKMKRPEKTVYYRKGTLQSYQCLRCRGFV